MAAGEGWDWYSARLVLLVFMHKMKCFHKFIWYLSSHEHGTGTTHTHNAHTIRARAYKWRPYRCFYRHLMKAFVLFTHCVDGLVSAKFRFAWHLTKTFKRKRLYDINTWNLAALDKPPIDGSTLWTHCMNNEHVWHWVLFLTSCVCYDRKDFVM